ncbi:MAG: YciI family protein [Gaiellaceae bacterium]
MKYMIMMFGDQATMVETRSTEWIKGMIRFMTDLDQELADAGELAASEGLADPTQATTVRFEHGAPVPTDGPFAEAKESLAGYWIVDVDDEARALEIASRIVAVIEGPVEVRQVMDEPPEEYTS